MDQRCAVMADVIAMVAPMRDRAVALDRAGSFPDQDIDRLRDIGALRAVLPPAENGLGWGTTPEGARSIARILRLLGRGNLAVGRLYEAHVNALKLVMRYADPAEKARCAGDAAEGHLFGLWVTDDGADPVRLSGGMVSGTKAICSGAGHCTRALITATADGEQPRMIVVPLPDKARIETPQWQLAGVRAASSKRVVFGEACGARLVGQPGDYLRQPIFSTGAWRTSAVTLGGLDTLLEYTRASLLQRGRADDPHQRARMGQAMIAQESAALWLEKAAIIAEGDGDPDHAVAYVNLARIAVERACLDAIELAQRSLGLTAFAQGPIEVLCRDLGTYLRQPAPDETLTEAAATFMAQGLPDAG